MSKISQIEPEKRKEYGKAVNELKKEIEKRFEDFKSELERLKELEEEEKNWIDVTLPGAKRIVGREHIINKVMREARKIFSELGFKTVEGPEVETVWYNFDALNTPEWHPARDMQDTFYISQKDGIILRTHTSPVQVRTMLKEEPPLAIISPGRVYRKDELDASHSPVFHQIEVLYIDRYVSVAHLKALLEVFARKFFGASDLQVLLRPSYFPFVEPGFEVDVSCPFCRGKGCSVCKYTGWIEILGAGLVHPNVLKAVGYDPEKWQGLAFGMGVERLGMLKYGVSDLREFFRNDIRFILQ